MYLQVGTFLKALLFFFFFDFSSSKQEHVQKFHEVLYFQNKINRKLYPSLSSIISPVPVRKFQWKKKKKIVKQLSFNRVSRIFRVIRIIYIIELKIIIYRSSTFKYGFADFFFNCKLSLIIFCFYVYTGIVVSIFIFNFAIYYYYCFAINFKSKITQRLGLAFEPWDRNRLQKGSLVIMCKIFLTGTQIYVDSFVNQPNIKLQPIVFRNRLKNTTYFL